MKVLHTDAGDMSERDWLVLLTVSSEGSDTPGMEVVNHPAIIFPGMEAPISLRPAREMGIANQTYTRHICG